MLLYAAYLLYAKDCLLAGDADGALKWLNDYWFMACCEMTTPNNHPPEMDCEARDIRKRIFLMKPEGTDKCGKT